MPILPSDSEQNPIPTRRSRRAARLAAEDGVTDAVAEDASNGEADKPAVGKPAVDKPAVDKPAVDKAEATAPAPNVAEESPSPAPDAGTLAGLVADPINEPTPAASGDTFNWGEFLGGASGRDSKPHTIHPPADPHPGSVHHTAGTHLPAPSVERGSLTPSEALGLTERETPPRVGSRSSRRAQLDIDPPREKKKRKGPWGCMIVLVVLIALGAVAAFALQGPISQLIAATQGPEDYTGAGVDDVIVVIHDGDSGSDLADSLVAADVVKSFDAFYNLLLAEEPALVFQPGAYQLKTQMSAAAALKAIQNPDNKMENTVLVQEGLPEADVLQSLSETLEIPIADVEAAAADVASFGLPAEATQLEGFLFPATYTFDPGTSAHDALQTMVNRQFQALDEAGVAPGDRWKTIVLASLIQREAGLKDDYYKVSRVFRNRLDPNLWPSGLLQSDATVAYGTGNTHLVTTTDAERADPNNAYNTYVHPGLPIGPISNPGDLAIDAALHPAEGPWLFFVTWNLDTGETIFSATVEEHDAAVAKWLAWMDEHPEYG